MDGFPVPVEITPFCHEHTVRLIAALPSVSCAGCTPKLRMGSSANNKADGEEVAVTISHQSSAADRDQSPVRIS